MQELCIPMSSEGEKENGAGGENICKNMLQRRDQRGGYQETRNFIYKTLDWESAPGTRCRRKREEGE